MRWKSVLPALCAPWLLGCGVIRTIPLENLANTPAGTTSHFTYFTSGSKAEAYLTRPTGPGPFPLMILLHGHSWRHMGAERILPAAEAFASDLCYASLAVSLPGYGQTQVQGGMDPEITLGVVVDAVTLVKRLSWIDPKRLYLYGFSRGGLFTSMLVNRMEGLRGVVLHSGAYDLHRLYQETPNPWLRGLLNPNGDPDPKLFSVLPDVPKWRAPTLILQGSQDALVPVSQATLLRDSLKAAKKPYRLVIYPASGHRLPPDDVREKTVTFLKENSGSACRATGP